MVFGEFLYLRARDAEVAFAVPIDGAIAPPPAVPVQVGPVGIVDPDYSGGFRAGFAMCFDPCSSFEMTYSRFESSTQQLVDVGAPIVIRSLVLHPGSVNANADFLTASANLDVDFDLIDADYRAIWSVGERWAVNYRIGARYARLDQDFAGTFTNAGTTDTVVTEVDFDGVGFRLGFDAERHSCNHGWMVYGRGAASFLAGEFRADYFQGSTADPVIVDTSWQAGRIVPILDLEMGVGWQSACGRVRLTGGYLISAWFNTVNTDRWIESVQNNSFVGLNDSMTFDGFAARAEYRF